MYLKKMIKLRKNSSFNWFTPFHVLIRPDVIWKNLSRPLYHVHFTVIHTNSRHNSLSHVRYQAIIWINVRLLLIGPRNVHLFCIQIKQFLTTRRWIWITSSAMCQPFCFGLNMLMEYWDSFPQVAAQWLTAQCIPWNLGSFYKYSLTLIPAWINVFSQYNACDEIIY